MNKKAKTATGPANHIAVFQDSGIRRAPVLDADWGTTCTRVKMSMVSAT
jgi:hypothetical protein